MILVYNPFQMWLFRLEKMKLKKEEAKNFIAVSLIYKNYLIFRKKYRTESNERSTFSLIIEVTLNIYW